jgi:hypothetical protein
MINVPIIPSRQVSFGPTDRNPTAREGQPRQPGGVSGRHPPARGERKSAHVIFVI